MAAFIRSGTFTGARDGYVFKDGVKGMGYYLDEGPEAPASAPEAIAAPTWSVQCLDGTLTLSQDQAAYLSTANLPVANLPTSVVTQVLQAAEQAMKAAASGAVAATDPVPNAKENSSSNAGAAGQGKKKMKKKKKRSNKDKQPVEPVLFPEIGDRIRDAAGNTGTTRYIGTVHTSKNPYMNYVGVEWDDHTRGKHDGWLEGPNGGERYFKCPDGAGSFVKAKKLRQAKGFIECMRARYEHGGEEEKVINSVDTNRGRTKPIILIGMDKVADWHQLSEIRKASLQDQDVGKVDAEPGTLAAACPNLRELNLNKTLFGTWEELALLGRDLPLLRSLQFSGNRVNRLPFPLPADHALLSPRLAFPALSVLVLSNSQVKFGQVRALDQAMPKLAELHLCGNGIDSFNAPSSTYAEWAMTTGDRTEDNRGKVGRPLLGCFPELKVLNVSDNNFSDWRQFWRLAWLPKLEKLLLNNNHVTGVEHLGTAMLDDGAVAPDYTVVYDPAVVADAPTGTASKEDEEQKAESQQRYDTIDGSSSTKNQDMVKWVKQTGVSQSARDVSAAASAGTAAPTEQEPFAALKHLSLSHNPIADWSSVDAIDKLPGVEYLRVQHTPIAQTGSTSVTRQNVIARVGSLRSLNGGEVRPMERSDAEKLYLKRLLTAEMRKQQDAPAAKEESQPPLTLASCMERLTPEHPRLATLLALHGEPTVRRAVAGAGPMGSVAGDALRITLVSNEPRSCTIPPMQKRLPESMTIRQVKLIAQRKFKVPADEMSLYYRDHTTAGHPEHLADDDQDLSYYGVQNGGEILMEGKNAQQNKGEAAGAAASGSSKQAQQAEAMEAIRMARQAEIEAARAGVANAADAVPYQSKFR